jgi:hypothetical protein
VGVGLLAPASLFALFVIPLLFAIDAEMRNSGAYKLSVNTAQASPCVTSILGSPFKPGWMTSGSIQESSIEGSADLSIPVTGPKGKGNLDVRAKKLNGSWNLNSLIFTHGPTQTILVPIGSSLTCQ